MAGVVADDDQSTGVAVLLQVRGEPGGGADDDAAVHAHRAGAQLAPQAGGAELECAGEAGRQFLDGTGVDQLGQFVAGLLVRVLGEPGLCPGDEIVVHLGINLSCVCLVQLGAPPRPPPCLRPPGSRARHGRELAASRAARGHAPRTAACGTAPAVSRRPHGGPPLAARGTAPAPGRRQPPAALLRAARSTTAAEAEPSGSALSRARRSARSRPADRPGRSRAPRPPRASPALRSKPSPMPAQSQALCPPGAKPRAPLRSRARWPVRSRARRPVATRSARRAGRSRAQRLVRSCPVPVPAVRPCGLPSRGRPGGPPRG